jgi:hypothetical protein
MGMSPAWEERAQSPAWALALALAFSLLAMLGTPWTRLPHTALYVADHVILAQAAAQSLAEGGFPLREMPHAWLKQYPGLERYPIFQFYSEAPPLLGGLLVLAGFNPYHAVVMVAALLFAIGFMGMRRLARCAGGSAAASLLAAALYTLAPYHLTDWHARAALSELAAFAFLPWVAASTWRLVQGLDWREFFGGAFAWALLMHSHPLFNAFGMLFMAALALGMALPPGNWRGLLRAGGAYAAGLALSAWFLVPGLVLGPHMVVASTFHAQEAANLTPLWVLFSPWRVWAPQCSIDNLGLQVGVLLWAGWIVALFLSRSRRNSLLLMLAGLALFMVWAPVPIWSLLGPLNAIQFPYRLLVFVCLAGALPAAEGWLALQSHYRWVLALLLLMSLLVVWDMDSEGSIPVRPQEAWQGLEVSRVPIGEEAYTVSLNGPWEAELGLGRFRSFDSRREFEVSAQDRSVRLKSVEMGPQVRLRLDGVEQGTILLLPCFWYPGYYEFSINGRPAEYGRVGVRLAVRLPAGNDDVRYHFHGLPWANWVSGLAWVFFLAFLAVYAIWQRWVKAGEGSQ